MKKITIDSIKNIDFAAAEFLKEFKDKKIFAFFGELGAGKTTFIQALCRELNVIQIVSSPSFAIVNEYHTKNSNIVYHFDLFRIKNIEEIFDFGYEDYLYSGNYCFIEWPELIKDVLPDNAVFVKINVLKGGTRILEINQYTN